MRNEVIWDMIVFLVRTLKKVKKRTSGHPSGKLLLKVVVVTLTTHAVYLLVKGGGNP